MKFSLLLRILFGVILVVLILLIPVLNKGMKDISSLTIKNPPFELIADGNYTGSFCAGRWCYEVIVTMLAGKIMTIEITNDDMIQHKKFNETCIAQIIEKQSIELDAVSGASINTKALTKAVENALRGTK